MQIIIILSRARYGIEKAGWLVRFEFQGQLRVQVISRWRHLQGTVLELGAKGPAVRAGEEVAGVCMETP